ncbi:FAD-dependent oxidoreductase [Actinopolymorpha pittospori]|uniref:FAD dependent oxidoreductase n=1 Tax=Actinopolymorpha pittospori TaxID=648752 RepID=A0A927N861_9ACTN|nr:FAD-dependent oxidoreductase [Actinopolymorpha pittospori]MBE1610195.1 hypothetical protein [Actinopolymorpha pittospori]
MGMTRRSVLGAGVAGLAGVAVGAGVAAGVSRATAARAEADPTPTPTGRTSPKSPSTSPSPTTPILQPDVLIAGAGVGGVAAALALLRAHRSVVLTEPTTWVGGQLTSQGVPPDEHSWIEQEGLGATRSYLELREAVRAHVRRTYPLTDAARRSQRLDPGKAWTALLCAEPAIWHAELRAALAPYESSDRLRLLTQATPVGALVRSGVVQAVRFRTPDGDVRVQPRYVIDATELGELLPMTGAPFAVGREKGGSRAGGGTGELHNDQTFADPTCQQPFTVVAALGYTPNRPGARVTTPFYDDFVAGYRKFGADGRDVFDPSRSWAWKDGRNFWEYRRVRYQGYLRDPFLGDITLLNQAENDHADRLLIRPDGRLDSLAFRLGFARGTEQTRGLVQYFQRDYQHADGTGRGWPGIHLVPDVLGTSTGIAAHPYVRESRRAKTALAITEDDIGVAARERSHPSARTGTRYTDSVGTGAGPLDVHPTKAHPIGLFEATYPFEIPFRALLPRGLHNLLAGAKNIGTTYLANGSYRYHPVEWSVGEAAGHALAFALRENVEPRALSGRWTAFARYLDANGVHRHWPEDLARQRVNSFHS